jgi:hypothetical protein
VRLFGEGVLNFVLAPEPEAPNFVFIDVECKRDGAVQFMVPFNSENLEI